MISDCIPLTNTNMQYFKQLYLQYSCFNLYVWYTVRNGTTQAKCFFSNGYHIQSQNAGKMSKINYFAISTNTPIHENVLFQTTAPDY